MKSLIPQSTLRTVLVASATAFVLAFAPLASADEKGRYYKHLDKKRHNGHKMIGKRHGHNHGNRHGTRKGHRHGNRKGHGYRHGHRHGYRDGYRHGNRFGWNDGWGGRYHGGYGHGWRQDGFQVSIGNGHRGHGHGGRSGRRGSHKGEYLIGGLIIGTALAHALRQQEHSDGHNSEYHVPSDDLGDTDYYIHKDLKGNCYEVRRDSAGREIRTQLPRSRCEW